MSLFDRTDPNATNEEMALIGSVMADPDYFDRAAQTVSEEDFYAEPHRLIWRALDGMSREGQPLNDVVLLTRALQDAGNYERVGHSKILECYEAVPHAAHWDHYSSIVKAASDRRRLISTATNIIRSAHDPAAEPEDIISDAEQALHTLLERHASATVATATECATEALDDLDAETAPGITSGFAGLDAITSGGLHPGSVNVLAARTSVGKTACAANMALAIARAGHGVLFVTLEQSRLELTQRFLSLMSGVPAVVIKRRDVDASDRARIVDAANQFAGLSIAIEDNGRRTVSHIAATARLHQRRHRLDVLIVDYLQLVDPEDKRAPREQQVAAASRGFKLLAKELGVPVILLAQLNRSVEARETKRPRLSDLRESGAIEQDADVVAFIDRPAMYDQTAHKSEASLIVAKNRHGACGDVPLRWRAACMAFGEPDGL